MEEIIVIRLEDLGTFALPVALLDAHRLPVRSEEGGVGAHPVLGSVPVILREDFLHAATPERGALAVDAFGIVARATATPVAPPP